MASFFFSPRYLHFSSIVLFFPSSLLFVMILVFKNLFSPVLKLPLEHEDTSPSADGGPLSPTQLFFFFPVRSYTHQVISYCTPGSVVCLSWHSLPLSPFSFPNFSLFGSCAQPRPFFPLFLLYRLPLHHCLYLDLLVATPVD